MATTQNEQSSTLECLLMYHRDDKEYAKWLKRTLEEGGTGIICNLLYEVAGSDLHTEMFRCADSADCVISLITETLFKDDFVRQCHAKVQSRLRGQKYLAVRMNISNEVYNSPAGGFLEGCHVLCPEKMTTDARFRESLVREIYAVAGRVPVSNNQLPSEPSRIEPGFIFTNIAASNLELSETLKAKKPIELQTLSQVCADLCADLFLRNDNSAQNSTALSFIPPKKACSFYDDSSEPYDVNESKYTVQTTTTTTTTEDYSLSPEPVVKSSGKIQSSATLQENATLVIYPEAYESRDAVPKTDNAIRRSEKRKLLLKLEMLDSEGAHDADYFPSFSQMTWEGKIIRVATKKIFGKPPNQFLKSPFLLPILSIKDEQISSGCVVTYRHINGTLGKQLSLANADIRKEESDPLKWRRQLLPIVYQVSEALKFLCERNVVHGGVNPNNILIDEHGNARLGHCDPRRDTGLSMQEHVAPSRFVGEGPDRDTVMFGITIWQILKCTNDRKAVEDGMGALLQLPDAVSMAADRRFVEEKLWKLGDEVTRRLCQISLQCLDESHRSSISQITADIRELIASQELMLIDFPRDGCVYCMVGTQNQDLRARSSNCPEKCTFLQICPTCMPSVSSGCVCCPQHDTQVLPPIGGTKSCALIISGRDENDDEMQETFYKDCHEMELAIAHPHIMAIPRKNIHRISRFENATEAEIVSVLQKIVKQKPDFFLLYYSGHKSTEGGPSRLNVSDKQGSALDVANLQRLLRPLLKACSRVLVIPDCCHAASLGSLFQPEEDTNDGHIKFHTTWSSCGRNESSSMEPHEANSLFTKCLLAGLKGGRTCPNGVHSCQHCERFRKEIEESHCISKKTVEEFVNVHMRLTFQESRDDVRGPIVTESRRESDPVIAYCRSQALYRFHYESPKGHTRVNKICELDSLEYNVDEVLQRLWNQLKDDSLPNQLDHRTLQIRCRKSDGSVRELNEVGDIMEAVFEDADSLSVSIRTDGEKLGDEKLVACFCDVSQTKATVKCLLGLERNQRRTEERGVKKVAVREVNSSWRAADDNAFDETFEKCWNAFASLKLKGADNFIQIEIRPKLSMFSIVT